MKQKEYSTPPTEGDDHSQSTNLSVQYNPFYKNGMVCMYVH